MDLAAAGLIDKNLMQLFRRIAICLAIITSGKLYAYTQIDLTKSYSHFITQQTHHAIIWNDGMIMQTGQRHHDVLNQLNNASLADQLSDGNYITGKPKDYRYYSPTNDAGRIRYEPFFKKMYGESKRDVIRHLTTIYWLPKFFGKQFPIEITQVNHVDQHLISVSRELETLAKKNPTLIPYLNNPAGGFRWREIENSHRLSAHCYGIAFDLNKDKTHYWQWDLQNNQMLVSEKTKLHYHNTISWEIVRIFEKHGFIWGGKWYHYDTMHFEYRPELLNRHFF